MLFREIIKIIDTVFSIKCKIITSLILEYKCEIDQEEISKMKKVLNETLSMIPRSSLGNGEHFVKKHIKSIKFIHHMKYQDEQFGSNLHQYLIEQIDNGTIVIKEF